MIVTKKEKNIDDFNAKSDDRKGCMQKSTDGFFAAKKFSEKIKFAGILILILGVVFGGLSGDFVQAQDFQDLEGDEIHISLLEEGEYLVEARGNARYQTGDLDIKGVEADYNSLDNEVFFRRNVTLKGPDLFIEADELHYLLEEDRVELSGEPYAEFQEFTAHSQTIEYFLEDEYILFTGDVEGTRAKDEFFADEVEIDLVEETIDLRGNARVRIRENGEEDNGLFEVEDENSE